MMDADRELKRICGALCYEVPKEIVDDVYTRVSVLLADKDAEIVRLLETITRWETSTGLATSAGDPDGITPEQNEREIDRLRAIEAAVTIEANDLREQLAAIEHERWADWQRWMHGCCTRNADGSLTIPSQLVERWQRQIDTPYAALSEQEKESDRAQVDRYWPLVAPAVTAMEAVVATAVAWVAAEREMQSVISTTASHEEWMAAAQTKHDARQALRDALDALAGEKG